MGFNQGLTHAGSLESSGAADAPNEIGESIRHVNACGCPVVREVRGIQQRDSSPGHWPISIQNSTHRFNARFVGVSLGTIDSDSPTLFAWTKSAPMPWDIMYSATVCARSSPNFILYESLPIASVCPIHMILSLRWCSNQRHCFNSLTVRLTSALPHLVKSALSLGNSTLFSISRRSGSRGGGCSGYGGVGSTEIVFSTGVQGANTRPPFPPFLPCSNGLGHHQCPARPLESSGLSHS